MNHVRADRWYKLGRTILYGRLEDEAPFQSVRRLVAVRGLHAARSCATPASRRPRPYGIVELTPEREYLLVTEFFDGAREIGDAEVDDEIIDEGLPLVRQLWDAGLAHRDIKPANLLVRDGHLVVIDVAFAQVRPVAVAGGRRPRQHDARPRRAHRRRARVPAGAGRSSRPTRSPRPSPPPAASPARRSCAR